MHPIELLKLCGIDMTRPDVVQEALNVFGNLLKQCRKRGYCTKNTVSFFIMSHLRFKFVIIIVIK